VPSLAPAKVLRSDAAFPTRRRSSRAPLAAGSATTATSEGPLSVAAAVEPQQVVAALTAVMTTTVTAPSIPLAPAPVDDSQAAVVEISDKDTPPPGWDQWGNLPAPAPEPPTGCLWLAMTAAWRRGARLTAPRPRRHARPSLLRTAPRCVRSRSGSAPTRRRLTSPVPRTSRHCGRSSATMTPRSTGRSTKRCGSMEVPHGASSGLVIFRRDSWFFPFVSSAFALLLTPRLLSPCLLVAGFGASGPGEVRHPRPPGRRAQLVLGVVQRPRRPR
jgi:hypothetical protein